MGKRPETRRTITELPPQESSEFRHWFRYCSYNPKVPGACHEEPRYLVIVHVEASGNRPAYEMRRPVCEQHLPKEAEPSAAQPPEPDMISSQECADIIGVPIMTLHQWRHRRYGPVCVKARSRCWYRREEVQRYAEALRIVNAYWDPDDKDADGTPPAEGWG